MTRTINCYTFLEALIPGLKTTPGVLIKVFSYMVSCRCSIATPHLHCLTWDVPEGNSFSGAQKGIRDFCQNAFLMPDMTAGCKLRHLEATMETLVFPY